VDIKSYAGYGNDDDERHWLAEKIVCFAGAPRAPSSVTHDLKLGEVSIVFDLRLADDSGRGVINSLLKDARQILNDQLVQYLNQRASRAERGK
jgi:hypothetical protein